MPETGFFDTTRIVYTERGNGWLDVLGGPARLLGEPGFHLPTRHTLEIRIQFNDSGVSRLQDGTGMMGPDPIAFDPMGPARLTPDEIPLLRAVRTGIRTHPCFPFATGIDVVVTHDIPMFSGILWKEPLMAALHRALDSAVQHPQTASSASPHRACWFAIDTGYPAPPDSIHGERVATAALMGYRMIAELAGLPVRTVRRGVVVIDDPTWEGTPLNIPPSVWEGMFRHRVPESMTGDMFLSLYGGLSGGIGAIEGDHPYAVRAATQFVIGEAARARFLRAFPPGSHSDNDQLAALGELLYHSHAQADILGLSIDPANALVSLAMEMGPAAGIHGARLTGAGGGGTVAILARPGSTAAIAELCRLYEREIGLTPEPINLGQ